MVKRMAHRTLLRQDSDDNLHVAYLNENSSERNLNLNIWDEDWNSNYRFLAFRNYLYFKFETCLAQPFNIFPIS